MNIPDFVQIDDAKIVNKLCITYGVNPFVIYGIGWHETQWGKLGWGRLGFHLGVGCFDENRADYSFQGLYNQVRWACEQLQKHINWLPCENMLITFAEKVWRPKSPKNWGKAVYKYYRDFMDRWGVDMYSYISPPPFVRQALLYFFENDILKTPFGTLDFYRLIQVLYLTCVLKKN